VASLRVPQLRQRLRFDLSDAFTGYPEVLPDLFESLWSTVVKPESEPNHFFVTFSELIERSNNLLLQ
jgi:hypothetical protein